MICIFNLEERGLSQTQNIVYLEVMRMYYYRVTYYHLSLPHLQRSISGAMISFANKLHR